MNYLQFAKLEPSKLVVITNQPMADVFYSPNLFCQLLKRVHSAKILTSKFFHYTVYCLLILLSFVFNSLLTTEDDVFVNKQFQDGKTKERVLIEGNDYIKDDHCANDEEKN